MQWRNRVTPLVLLPMLLSIGCSHLPKPDQTMSKVPIRQAFLDDTEYNRKYKLPGSMPQINYITIHNTANNASAAQERDYLNRRTDNQYISFHYAVDEREIVQILRHDQHGWHAGDGRNGKGNRESIGIEICRSTCRRQNDNLYRLAEKNAIVLVARLLKETGLSVEDLRMHQDWSGKYCPHRLLEENRWEQFKQNVAQALGADPGTK